MLIADLLGFVFFFLFTVCFYSSSMFIRFLRNNTVLVRPERKLKIFFGFVIAIKSCRLT